jgi:hypothetical protein
MDVRVKSPPIARFSPRLTWSANSGKTMICVSSAMR